MDKFFSIPKTSVQPMIQKEKKRIIDEISKANIDFPRCIVFPIDVVELEKFILMDTDVLHEKLKTWAENSKMQPDNTSMVLYQLSKNFFDDIIDLLFYVSHANICKSQIVEFINNSERAEICN